MIRTTETVQQECGIGIEDEAGDIVLNNALKLIVDVRDPLDSASARLEVHSQAATVLSTLTDTTPTNLVLGSTDNVRPQPKAVSTSDLPAGSGPMILVTDLGALIPIVTGVPVPIPESTRIIVFVDEFGRDTCVVNEVFQMIEDMPQPWSAYRAFEAGIARYPNIDRAALRLTVLAVLMG